ncbi:hypothetical protein A8926_4171 [Saccharopolyspora spinosa]|uniref:Uncharacterized protein n=1 Tax=Saccharopolyspora spinosa TaxID=60894 RepID=A0A2N3Y0A0_SACSN|nr:hypothetical protein A8926_4171 [Saccharopolyspora spinosa]
MAYPKAALVSLSFPVPAALNQPARTVESLRGRIDGLWQALDGGEYGDATNPLRITSATYYSRANFSFIQINGTC